MFETLFASHDYSMESIVSGYMFSKPIWLCTCMTSSKAVVHGAGVITYRQESFPAYREKTARVYGQCNLTKTRASQVSLLLVKPDECDSGTPT